MKKLLVIGTLCFLIGISPILINAWVNSNINVGINYPSDGDVVAIPFTVRGWCWNTDQDNDYYELWLVEDTNEDTIISETELNNKVIVHRQEDFNIHETNLPLTPRYKVNSDMAQQNKKYFMFIYGKDLNGDISADTNLVGLGPEGDATRTDSMLRYFRTKGLRP